MEPIPVNVPGLPEPAELSSQWLLQPVTVHAGEPDAGPLFGFPAGPARASTPVGGDGALCVYPGVQTVSYLFNSALQLRQGDPIPATVVNTHSADGTCTIFAFSEDGDGNPLVIVNILSAEYLPTILKSNGDTSTINLAGIDDRIEITQTFGANAFGIVSRLTNQLTRVPDDTDNTIFELYDDPGSIADVCGFYMSRALRISEQAPALGAEAGGRLGFPDPVFRLLWKAASGRAIAGFATVFILTRLSARYRYAQGESTFSLDFNTGANPRDRRDPE